jgi:stage V sporulation protein D (sporulation-specific penicillin-binding protein)
MDDPQYIVLVALDTPSRSTGIYISGGVMAAPTVGAVLSDILPYLGVSRSWGAEDVQGKIVTMPDLTGKTPKEATALLKALNLTALIRGSEETVTAQIPSPGQTLQGGSQVLLYFGESATEERVKVPDFSRMTRQQANDAAGRLGLYIVPVGNSDITPKVVVTGQYPAAGTEVPIGSNITLTFTDTDIRD